MADALPSVCQRCALLSRLTSLESVTGAVSLYRPVGNALSEGVIGAMSYNADIGKDSSSGQGTRI